jgi:hypothetical protein
MVLFFNQEVARRIVAVGSSGKPLAAERPDWKRRL